MRHNSRLTPLAQELRKAMTKEERHLWYDYLKNNSLPFRRQVAFGNYILDFYCAVVKLAIELDGSQHYTEDGLKKDADRTAYLRRIGIDVLRFSNSDVMQNFRGVCETIDREVKNRTQAFPSGEGVAVGDG